MIEIHKRHLVKSISWRIIGTADTFLFTWLITGVVCEGLNISGLTTFTKLIWYYVHERLWFNSKVLNSTRRHLFKTVTWRIIGTLDTILISSLLTDNPLLGLKIGASEIISKMILYFGHEKLWYRINFGLKKRLSS